MFKSIYGSEYSKHFGSFRSPKPDAEDLYGIFMDRMSDEEFVTRKKELADEWELKKTIAAWRGTMFHDYMERIAYQEKRLYNHAVDKYFPVIFKKKIFDNQTLFTDLMELEDGAYLELLVFDPVHDICGQADKVFIETISGKRFIDIGDLKTSGDKPDTKGRENYYEPLDHLKKSKHMQYVLQINLYAKLLQRHGFHPRHLSYSWYEDYNPEKAHHVDFDFMPGEMNDLFEFFL
jgi:hypothetical protein